MKHSIKRILLISLGHFFVLLAMIGVFIPVLPTTPFLLLALALYANNSPRCHQILLDNRWFGKILKQWSDNKTVTRSIKQRASLIIIASFLVSIFLLQGRLGLQLILLMIAVILLVFMWRLDEA